MDRADTPLIAEFAIRRGPLWKAGAFGLAALFAYIGYLQLIEGFSALDTATGVLGLAMAGLFAAFGLADLGAIRVFTDGVRFDTYTVRGFVDYRNLKSCEEFRFIKMLPGIGFEVNDLDAYLADRARRADPAKVNRVGQAYGVFARMGFVAAREVGALRVINALTTLIGVGTIKGGSEREVLDTMQRLHGVHIGFSAREVQDPARLVATVNAQRDAALAAAMPS